MKTPCLVLLAAGIGMAAGLSWNEQGIVHNAATPRAAMHSVPIRAVRMGPGIWRDRMATNVERSIPTLLDALEAHGIVDNFRRLSGA